MGGGGGALGKRGIRRARGNWEKTVGVWQRVTPLGKTILSADLVLFVGNRSKKIPRREDAFTLTYDIPRNEVELGKCALGEELPLETRATSAREKSERRFDRNAKALSDRDRKRRYWWASMSSDGSIKRSGSTASEATRATRHL